MAVATLVLGVVIAVVLVTGLWADEASRWVLLVAIPALAIVGAIVACVGLARATRGGVEAARPRRALVALAIANVVMLLAVPPGVWGLVVVAAGA